MFLRSLRLFIYAFAVLCLPVADAIYDLHRRGQTQGDLIILQRISRGRPREHRFLQMWSADGGIRVMYGLHADAEPLDPGGRPPENHGVAHATYTPGPKPYPINRFDGTAHTWR